VIGLASWLVLIAFGRVAGISGITAGAASPLAQARQQPHSQPARRHQRLTCQKSAAHDRRRPACLLAGWLRHHSRRRLHIWSRRVRLGQTLPSLAHSGCNVYGCSHAHGHHHGIHQRGSNTMQPDIRNLQTWATGLLAGLLFTAGLAWSDMTDPAKVIGFLNVAVLFTDQVPGAWVASLACAMSGWPSRCWRFHVHPQPTRKTSHGWPMRFSNPRARTSMQGC
jgi:hypothetical protein